MLGVNASICGELVSGHPCMRVTGHPGDHIPGIAGAAPVTPVSDWFDETSHSILDNRFRYYRYLPYIAASVFSVLAAFQMYVDILVLLHWG